MKTFEQWNREINEGIFDRFKGLKKGCTTRPKDRKELNNLILAAYNDPTYYKKENGHKVVNLNHIDTTLITDFSGLFDISLSKNIRDEEILWNINNWEFKNIETVSGMFSNCKRVMLNSEWDMSNVKRFDRMFYNAELNKFAVQALEKWDVSSAVNTDMMFKGATIYDNAASVHDIESDQNKITKEGDQDEADAYDERLPHCQNWKSRHIRTYTNMFEDMKDYRGKSIWMPRENMPVWCRE